MSKKIFKRTLLVTLLALFSLAFIYSSETVVKADSEKTLLQYDEDWTVFKYIDSEGKPQFDVRFRGYNYETIIEAYSNNSIVYDLLSYGKDDNSIKTIFVNQHFQDGKINIPNIQYENDTIAVRFIAYYSGVNYTSDIFMVYNDNFHIMSGDYQHGTFPYNTYNTLQNHPSAFKVTLKVNQHIKSANVSVSCADDYVNTYLKNNTVIKDIKYNNRSESYVIDGKSYTLNYSVLTFKFFGLERYLKDSSPSSSKIVIAYIFNLKNVLNQSGKGLETLTLNVTTTTSKTIIIPDPDFGDDDTEEPTSKVEPTTKKVEPTTKKITVTKPKTPKMKLTASKKKIKVKVTKVANQTGIIIRYKKSGAKKWTTKKYKTKKTCTKTFKKLKSKKKYKVQVRAYRVVNKKDYYSKWSKAKTVKVK